MTYEKIPHFSDSYNLFNCHSLSKKVTNSWMKDDLGIKETKLTSLPSTPLGISNILIGVFWPPELNYVNDQQFQRLGSTGVDILQYVITYSASQNLTILNKCSANNLKAIIFDARVYGSDSDIASMINAYSTNPGLGGYYIKDEPAPDTLNWAAIIYKKI